MTTEYLNIPRFPRSCRELVPEQALVQKMPPHSDLNEALTQINSQLEERDLPHGGHSALLCRRAVVRHLLGHRPTMAHCDDEGQASITARILSDRGEHDVAAAHLREAAGKSDSLRLTRDGLRLACEGHADDEWWSKRLRAQLLLLEQELPWRDGEWLTECVLHSLRLNPDTLFGSDFELFDRYAEQLRIVLPRPMLLWAAAMEALVDDNPVDALALGFEGVRLSPYAPLGHFILCEALVAMSVRGEVLNSVLRPAVANSRREDVVVLRHLSAPARKAFLGLCKEHWPAKHGLDSGRVPLWLRSGNDKMNQNAQRKAFSFCTMDVLSDGDLGQVGKGTSAETRPHLLLGSASHQYYVPLHELYSRLRAVAPFLEDTILDFHVDDDVDRIVVKDGKLTIERLAMASLFET